MFWRREREIRIYTDRDGTSMYDDMDAHDRMFTVPGHRPISDAISRPSDLHNTRTWVTYRVPRTKRPRYGFSAANAEPLAVVSEDVRSLFFGDPATPVSALAEFGSLALFSQPAYRQDPHEAFAVVKAGGRAGGPPAGCPSGPLSEGAFGVQDACLSAASRLRSHGREDLAFQSEELRDGIIGRQPAAFEAARVGLPGIADEIRALGSPDLASTLDEWVAEIGDDATELGLRCSQVLTEHGFYDRAAGLENRVADALNGPASHRRPAPCYTDAGIAALYDLPVFSGPDSGRDAFHADLTRLRGRVEPSAGAPL
jgi:hypothetical protein